MKVFKWLVIAIVLAVAAVIGYVTMVLDLNSFKPVISDKVKEATGRELRISGDIGFSFYPTLGLQLQGLSLSNIPGEQLAPLLAVDNASLGVSLLPLVKGQLEVETLEVDGAELTMVTLADGRSSTSGLGQASDETSSTASQEPGTATSAPSWQLGQLTLSNLKLVNDNRAANSLEEIEISQLTLTDLAPGRAAPLAMAIKVDDGKVLLDTTASAMLVLSQDFSRIQIDNWQQQLALTGATPEPLQLQFGFQADLDVNSQQLQLPSFTLALSDFDFNGQGSLAFGSAVPKLVLKGEGSALDLSPYLSSATDDEASNTETQQPSEPSPEPDLTALKAIDADLALSLASVKVDQFLVEAIATEVELKGGVLSLRKFDARGFDGQFSLTAQLDGRKVPASYQFEQRLTGLQIQPLLQAAAALDLLEGAGSVNLSGKGVGLSSESLIKGLTAEGDLKLADGAIYGFNLAKSIRDASARLQGGSVETNTAVEKTDFSALDMSVKVADGQLLLPNMALSSPLLRVDGDGTVGLLDQQLGMNLVVALVGSLEGQGGADLTKLKDLPIPVKISGSLTDPKVGLNLDGLKDQYIEQEKEKLKDKLEEKLKRKLFGG